MAEERGPLSEKKFYNSKGIAVTEPEVLKNSKQCFLHANTIKKS